MSDPPSGKTQLEKILRHRRLCVAPIALCAVIGSAHADESSATLYGTLDEAIAHLTHALDFDPNHPVANNPNVTHGTEAATGILNGGLSQTKWGLKGQEDMGGGLKGVFLLEEAFNLGSGYISNAAFGLANNKSTGPNMSADSAISGQMFNRGAYLGLSSNTWGTLTAGRQQSFFLDNIAIFDPMMGSQAFSPIGFSGKYGGGGDTDNSRVDNSLKYRLAVADFDLGALYKFGGVAGASSAQSAWELNAVYASGPLALQLGYQSFHDAFSISNAAGTGTINVTAADTKAYMASAKFTWEKTTVRGGYQKLTYNNPSNPTRDQQVTTLFNEPINGLVNVAAFPNQENINVYWIGGGQDITSALTMLLGVYHIVQNSYSCTTGAQSGCGGALNYYSLVADYNLSKHTDLYLGFMDSLVSGGPANAVHNAAGPSVNTDVIYAMGMRHRF